MKIAIKKIGDVAVPASEAALDMWNKLSDAVYEVDIKNMDMRTLAQNSALHLWASKIAEVLNANNMYMTGIFQNEIMWTMESVKLNIIKATIKKVFDINSTTKLKRKEIDNLIDFVTIAFGRKGIKIPDFPSRELWEKEKALN